MASCCPHTPNAQPLSTLLSVTNEFTSVRKLVSTASVIVPSDCIQPGTSGPKNVRPVPRLVLAVVFHDATTARCGGRVPPTPVPATVGQEPGPASLVTALTGPSLVALQPVGQYDATLA